MVPEQERANRCSRYGWDESRTYVVFFFVFFFVFVFLVFVFIVVVFIFVFVGLLFVDALLYESPGGNQVDGLPPV